MASNSNFTIKAAEAVQKALQMASERGNPEATPAHLLAALLAEEDGLASRLLDKVGVPAGRLRDDLAAALDRLPSARGGAEAQSSRDLRKLLDAAAKLAPQFQDEYVSVEHLLLAAATVPGTAAEILARHGVNRDVLLRAIQEVRGSHRVTDANPEDKLEALKKYGRDLTELARAGKLDPVIGRDDEIRRVMQVLTRRTKNNPVLIGEPGVGKTAVAEGMAQRIASGDVPELLKQPADRGPRHGRAHRRHQVPRRVRGPPQGRDQGGRGLRRRGRAVHRRDPHPGRGGRRRGRDRRRQPAQARARPRRAALHRRHDPVRVPQVHREGRRARAPLPAGGGRRALGRGDDRDPARPQGKVRGSPRRAHHRRRDRGRRHALQPLHHRPLPAGQGDRPGGRGGVEAAHRDRLAPHRDRRARAHDGPARDREARPRQGEGRGLGRASRRDRRGSSPSARSASPR